MAPGVYSVNPQQHTLSPVVQGSSVVGIKYSGGVLLAADTLASYGSQARYKNFSRMKKVGKYALLGASGEISDFQYLGDLLDELDEDDFLSEDSCHMGPKEYASYIGRVLYNRRSRFNPLYNQFVVVGKKKDDAPRLSYMDHQGTCFDEDYIATGFGAYLAMPLMRNEWRPDLTFDEAQALAVKCLQMCFYRDCHASNRIQIGRCEGAGVTVSEPFAIDHFWGHGAWLKKSLQEGGAPVADSW